jgi:hypothetical protein
MTICRGGAGAAQRASARLIVIVGERGARPLSPARTRLSPPRAVSLSPVRGELRREPSLLLADS